MDPVAGAGTIGNSSYVAGGTGRGVWVSLRKEPLGLRGEGLLG